MGDGTAYIFQRQQVRRGDGAPPYLRWVPSTLTVPIGSLRRTTSGIDNPSSGAAVMLFGTFLEECTVLLNRFCKCLYFTDIRCIKPRSVNCSNRTPDYTSVHSSEGATERVAQVKLHYCNRKILKTNIFPCRWQLHRHPAIRMLAEFSLTISFNQIVIEK